MKDETIITMACIMGVTAIAVMTCAFRDCALLAGCLSVIAGIGGYAYSSYRKATPELDSSDEK